MKEKLSLWQNFTISCPKNACMFFILPQAVSDAPEKLKLHWQQQQQQQPQQDDQVLTILLVTRHNKTTEELNPVCQDLKGTSLGRALVS